MHGQTLSWITYIFFNFKSLKVDRVHTFFASKSLDWDWTVDWLVSSSESDMSEREEVLDMALEPPMVMSMLDTILPAPSKTKLNDFQNC